MNADEIEVRMAKITLWLLILCGLVFAIVSMLDAAPEPSILWLNVVTGQVQANAPGEMGSPIADAVAALGPVSNTCTAAQFHTHDARRYYCVKVGGAIKRPWIFNGPPPLEPCTEALYQSGNTARSGYGCTKSLDGFPGFDGTWRPLR